MSLLTNDAYHDECVEADSRDEQVVNDEDGFQTERFSILHQSWSNLSHDE